MPDENDLRERLLSGASAIVGAGLLTQPADTEGYFTDWRRRYRSEALAVAMPADVGQVCELVRLCRELGVAIVPQAGNTGMSGGAIALSDRPSLLLNVSRLNRIRGIDVTDNSVVAEAGCILATLRDAVQESGRLFPMLLGSVGSCRIGGLVSTNAGGMNVVRYGNMRDLVLGLEVVLADGRVWSGLRTLRKDNSGYDLKQFFIGAEGTLGIVTAAALKLFPAPTRSGTAMIALPSVQAAVDLFRLFADRAANRVEAFEIMSKVQIENVLALSDERRSPMALDTPWYVLVELADSSPDWDPDRTLERVLEEALERGLIGDAVIASDSTKAQRIWELRHNVSEANLRKGFAIATDTSVPVSQLPTFVDRLGERIPARIPSCQVAHCGHVGDGNLHVVIILDRSVYDTAAKREATAALAHAIVHEASVELGGSVSAEHGIGLTHVDELERLRPRLDLEMMRAVKTALDPDGIMNPGKIVRAA